MIKQHDNRINLAVTLETSIRHTWLDNLMWELKRNLFEDNRATIWNGYAHPILSCILLCYDKRWLKANKDSDLTQILQKRKFRS